MRFKLILNFAIILGAINGMAQNKDKKAKIEQKMSETSKHHIKDSDIKEKLDNGDINAVKPYLAGYYSRQSDLHSYARPKDAKVTHAELDLTVDFQKQIISGAVTYDVEVMNSDKIIFDTRDLDITRVLLNGTKDGAYKVGLADKILGAPLEITVDGGVTSIQIEYRTKPTSAAIQWLSKEQADSDMPFLYTQGEAILTRSWIPIQDSPGIKMTYNAKVNAPDSMTAVMSAHKISDKNGETYFEMKNPIPAYLIALAVGDLEFSKISENCGIYALPEVLVRAVHEFSDTPKMIEVAEGIVGPYKWERYDMLVLPRAFPFGGMENPMLTFLTPTIIAGDKSLVSLIAHELAHSWSGNLVTNTTWNDFWLNEGVTVYLERRIVYEIYGKDLFEMHKYNGYQDLIATVKRLTKDEFKRDTHLKLDLENRDPDDGMTDVAYEKGALFLEHIESMVGKAKMDKFLKDYFQSRAFGGINTEEFIDLLKESFTQEIISDKLVNKWVYGEGIPPTKVTKPKKFKSIDVILSTLESNELVQKKQFESFSVSEWLYFFNNLSEKATKPQLNDILQENVRSLNSNAEIKTKWLIFNLNQGNKRILQDVEDFLKNTGRRKFLVPIYKELIKFHGNNKDYRREYLRMSMNYHSITQNSLDKMFDVTVKERQSLRLLNY